jgi:hypothetical protein
MPAAVGGTWTIKDVCEKCQEYTDRNVDRPFVRAVTVLEARHHFGIPDRYGQVPEPLQLTGKIEQDGSPALVTIDRREPGFRMLPSEEWLDDHTFQFGAEATEFAEHKRVKFERLARRHRQVEDLGQEARTIERPHVICDHTTDARLKLPIDLWARFAAKVALAVTPELCDGWLGTPAWAYLRNVMRGKRPPPQPGFKDLRREPTPLCTHRLGRYFRPPEHVLWARQAGDAAVLHIVLFGEQIYYVPLGHWRLASGGRAWLFDPVSRRLEKLSESLWLARVAERFDDPRPEELPPPLLSAGRKDASAA